MQRVAVVGCGDVSIVHCEAIDAIAYAELVAVCDSDPATLAAAAARYRVPGFTDHRQLVDAVGVTSGLAEPATGGNKGTRSVPE